MIPFFSLALARATEVDASAASTEVAGQAFFSVGGIGGVPGVPPGGYAGGMNYFTTGTIPGAYGYHGGMNGSINAGINAGAFGYGMPPGAFVGGVPPVHVPGVPGVGVGVSAGGLPPLPSGGAVGAFGGYGGDNTSNNQASSNASNGSYNHGNSYSNQSGWDRGYSNTNSNNYGQGSHHSSNSSNNSFNASHHRRLDQIEVLEELPQLLEDVVDGQSAPATAEQYYNHGGGYYPGGSRHSAGGYGPSAGYGGGYHTGGRGGSPYRRDVPYDSAYHAPGYYPPGQPGHRGTHVRPTARDSGAFLAGNILNAVFSSI